MKGKSGVNFICPWAGNHSELGTTGGAKAGYRNSSPCSFAADRKELPQHILH